MLGKQIIHYSDAIKNFKYTGLDKEAVSLSLGRRGSRPKAKAEAEDEDVEPRNDQKGKGRCLRVSRRQ
jgi:hypothetical protein